MSEAGPSQQTPPVVEAGQGKKRKRTGKEREERKQAAILAVSHLRTSLGGALMRQAQAEKEQAAASTETNGEATEGNGEDEVAGAAVAITAETPSEEAPTEAPAPEVDVDRLSKRLVCFYAN